MGDYSELERLAIMAHEQAEVFGWYDADDMAEILLPVQDLSDPRTDARYIAAVNPERILALIRERDELAAKLAALGAAK